MIIGFIGDIHGRACHALAILVTWQSIMEESLHRAFLEGYQSLRPLPGGHQRLIEGFFIGSIVGTFSYWVVSPQAQERLATKVPQIARDYAARFNRGASFWFS